MNEHEPGYLSPVQVMERLGIDFAELQQLERTFVLPGVRHDGGRLRFRETDVAMYEQNPDSQGDLLYSYAAARFLGMKVNTFVDFVRKGWVQPSVSVPKPNGKPRHFYKKSDLEPFRKKEVANV